MHVFAYMHGSKHVCCAWVPLAAKREVRIPGLVEYAEGTTSNLPLELFVFFALSKGFLLLSHLNPPRSDQHITNSIQDTLHVCPSLSPYNVIFWAA